MRTSAIPLLLCFFLGCSPSINQAAKADLDRRIAEMSPSDREVEAPLEPTPMPLAVGQWLTLRILDKDQRPSLTTYKIVGADGDALWIETTTDSYYGSSGVRMLVALGDRTDPRGFDLRAVITRNTDGTVQELPPGMLGLVERAYRPVLDSLVIRWVGLPQEDAVVIAGRFAGSYRGRSSVAVAGMSTTSDVWWHPAVPINGVVKTAGVGEPSSTELVAFGYEGATSSF